MAQAQREQIICFSNLYKVFSALLLRCGVFYAFIEKIEEHLKKLNDAGASNTTWREILGTEFPSAVLPSARAEAERQNCLSVAHRKKPTWPLRRSGAVFISAKVKDWNGNTSNYESDSYEIEKHCEIIYTAKYNSCKKHKIVWQIVNTGYQAKDCLRGGFEPSNCGTDSRRPWLRIHKHLQVR